MTFTRFFIFDLIYRMENGLSEVHLVSLPSEVKSLSISDTHCNNGRTTTTSGRTPSPTKKSHELMFIDDGTTSSSPSSTTSSKDTEKHLSESEQQSAAHRPVKFAEPVPTLLPPQLPSPPSELTPAPSRRLPTVVVLGYQRVVAESQAAAERMHQQHMKLGGSSGTTAHPNDCPLTLSIGSAGTLTDHGLPASPHGRNNRVRGVLLSVGGCAQTPILVLI